MWGIAGCWTASGPTWHSFVLFSKQFQGCIDLSLFSHCTTSHNAGHFLRLILSPCLVIRDNCQLSQGAIRSITTKSMQPLGLYCLLSSSRTTTWNGKEAKSKDAYKTCFKETCFIKKKSLHWFVLLENHWELVFYGHVFETARHQALLFFYPPNRDKTIVTS